MSSISLVRTKRQEIKQAMKSALALIDFQFDKGTQKVVIKPNMCYYWDYSTGQTTDPRFVAATIETLREEISPTVNISIVESDASAMKCRHAFKFLGYQKLAKRYNVKLVNLSEVQAKSIRVEAGNQNFELRIPEIIQNADLKINLPKMKYMESSKISCALKNIYGCNPYPKKFKYHSKLSRTIVALNKIMQFNLCILDGLIVSGSSTSKLGLVMASRDPVAIDAAAAQIMGVNPKSVEHIMLAKKEGLGTTSFSVKGIDPNYFKEKYPTRDLTDKTIALGYKIVHKFGLDKRLML